MNNNDRLLDALAAFLPGGIEAQEKQGQVQFVNSATLPKKMNVTITQLQQLGFVYKGVSDDLFDSVDLPAGWRKEGTDHSMWSKLIDAQGRERGSIFYKAAFYDRSAHGSIACYFNVEWDYEQRNYKVLNAAGNVLFTSDTWQERDHAAEDNARKQAEQWLIDNYPDYKNPLAYWQ